MKLSAIIRPLCLALAVTWLSGCATHKNTSSTRWWKAFKSRYNTYFNGHQAYLDGMRAKRDGIKDDYTDFLPLLMASNEKAKPLGKGQFETSVTKCEKTIQLHSIKQKPEVKRGKKLTPREKAFRNRREFNPFLKNAWILMGKAQLQKGEFVEAASTFAYTERLYQDQPLISNIARCYTALCYTELDWYYDAEDLLDKVRRDSVPRTARRPYNLAMANFHLRQKQWQEAVPYLEKEVNNMPHGVPKARGTFLLGQVYQAVGQKEKAYKAFQKCLNQSPPYELKFNAQIMQTEVMVTGDYRKKLAKLNRMAREVNNKDNLDRVYYAIGNVFMALPDTVRAIQAYETGNAKATQSTPARGALLMALGDIYWTQHRFGDAKRCYSGAVGAISKEHARYAELGDKTKILDKLVPYTDEIFLQDSLQALVRMPEAERLAAIDQLIEMEKKRQKELERKQADSISQARQNGGDGASSNQKKKTNDNFANANSGGVWYFYNDQSVMQGAEQFRKVWGQRKNEDNWRRANKSVLSTATDKEDEKTDSLHQATDSLSTNKADSLNTANKNKKLKIEPTDDPLKREYYLAQLPFTDEQMAESNKKIRDALYPAGVIMKDDLENYALAQGTLTRLLNDFPDYEPKDDLLYQLFLLELHWGLPGAADHYKNLLATQFPESPRTKLITAPDYEENARFGRHLEDSIYAATYDAYLAGDYATMERNCAISGAKYPQGDNRAKFLFMEAMLLLHQDNLKGMADTLRSVAKNYSQDKISELAGNIVKSIDEGRRPGKDGFEIGSLWNSRNTASNAALDELLMQDTLRTDRAVPHLLVLSYSTDTLSEGKLLYEVSRFNFANFTQRNFEIELLQTGHEGQLRVKGFNTFDEVHRYEQELFADSLARGVLRFAHPVLISEHNLKLVGTKYTIDEYLAFYRQHFAPNRVKDDLLMDTDAGNFIWDEFQEVNDKKDDKKKTDDLDIEDDGGEWY